MAFCCLLNSKQNSFQYLPNFIIIRVHDRYTNKKSFISVLSSQSHKNCEYFNRWTGATLLLHWCYHCLWCYLLQFLFLFPINSREIFSIANFFFWGLDTIFVFYASKSRMNCTEIEWCVQRVYYTSYPKRHECVIFVVVAIQQKCDMKLSMCPRACKFYSYTICCLLRERV